MTPHEKAIEIVDSYFTIIDGQVEFKLIKQCALIAVDELIKSYRAIYDDCICDDDYYSEADGGMLNYWQKVKKEIEAL